MSKTDVLIIIGYSFPYFNRVIDNAMLKKYLENDRALKSKKIYFQDPVLDGSFLRNQFNINDEIKIVPISAIYNYYIPKDL